MQELKITNSGTLPPNVSDVHVRVFIHMHTAIYLQFVLCIGPPEDEPDGKVTEGSGTTNPSAAAARVVKEKLWKGRQVLKVCFMKPDDLKGCKSKEGKEMTTEMIMEWANVWSTTCPDVPQFVINEKEAKADIRVKFSGAVNNSYMLIIYHFSNYFDINFPYTHRQGWQLVIYWHGSCIHKGTKGDHDTESQWGLSRELSKASCDP